jgi:hypothetical protein
MRDERLLREVLDQILEGVRRSSGVAQASRRQTISFGTTKVSTD